MKIRFAPATRPGDLIVTADHVAKAYDENRKILFRGLSLVIKRGDRVGIIGPNGAGKTTLVSCLLGKTDPDAGKVRVGPSVDVGYYRQTHAHLDLSLTVVEYLRKQIPGAANVGGEQQARDLAGAFLFSGGEQDKPLTVLSGGERSRCVLAGLVSGGHNLLVLDEPTNHLDIPSAERLEESIRQFTEPPAGFGSQASGGGTVILITHDRMLLENLVDQLLVFDGAGNVKHFLGTYSTYLEAQKSAPPASPPPTPPPAPEKKPSAGAKPQAAGTPTKKSKGKGNTAQLERRIVDLEEKLAKIDQQLADPDIYRDGQKVRKLQSQRKALQDELAPLEQKWAEQAD